MAGLPELIEALLDPEFYPEPPQKVELAQTQMSFVLLAGNLVYKIKKPVNLGYLDYTTLEKRKYFCRQELELNRRLCPDVYLDVVPIMKTGGKFILGGSGAPIEYAVKMRRLPREGMMDVLLARNAVSRQMVSDVAEKLAEFHRKAATNSNISNFGDLATIVKNTGENFSQTEKNLDRTITSGQYRHIKTYTEVFIRENASLFHKRVADGRIKDCHGDLHAPHVCFSNGIQIYDCIEFNDRFRYCDVASEVAFLAMDLDHYRKSDLSTGFIDAYVNFSKDAELGQLLNFYKCYRAYVRGKVEGFKLDDPHIPPEEKAKVLTAARSYFGLAEAYAG